MEGQLKGPGTERKRTQYFFGIAGEFVSKVPKPATVYKCCEKFFIENFLSMNSPVMLETSSVSTIVIECCEK